MTAYEPPAAAVEVAARAVHARRCPHFADEGQCAHPLDGTQMLTALGDANAALAAAGPLIERAVRERVAAALEGERDKPLAGEPTARSEGVHYGLNRAARIARREANHG